LRPIVTGKWFLRKGFRGFFYKYYFLWDFASKYVLIRKVAQDLFIGIVLAAPGAEQKFTEEIIMSSTNDKIRGSVNDAVGNVKKNIGEATDNEEMESEGEGQQVKGKAQKAIGNAKDAISDAADSVKKAVKNSGD
jgi:uncharacterized protein YjbJ (UPF0337 family)